MLYLFAFIVGAIGAPLAPKGLLASPAWLFSLAALALTIALLLRRLSNPKVSVLRQALLAAAVTVTSAAAAQWVLERQVAGLLPEHWQDKDVQIHGTVGDILEQSERASRFQFYVHSSDEVAALRGRILRLSWYRSGDIRSGDVWTLTVRLKRPRGFVNPRGFDYAAWLLSQKVAATGYVKSGSLLEQAGAGWSLSGFRDELARRLFNADHFNAEHFNGDHLNAGYQGTPFFQALLLGDKAGLSSEQWRVLQRTGTIHLMAISGLHVGLVAALGLLFGRILVRLIAVVQSMPSGWAARVLPACTSCIAALVYSALAGFSIPTQRAMIVVAVISVASVLGLRVRPLNLLLIAGVMVLVASPLAATQSGFWLSFVAVAVLILGFAGRARREHSARLLLRAQMLLAVGLLAPLLALGAATSVVGPPANLVAVPVVSVVIVPGLLLAAVVSGIHLPAAHWIIDVLNAVLQLLWRYLEMLAEVSWAEWWPAVPIDAGLIIALTAGCFLAIVPRGLYLRPLGGLVIALALLAPRATPFYAQLTVLEVGQGLAVWFRRGHHNVLYDTGPAFSAQFDAGSRIIVPFLRSQGVKSLDLVMVSHGDGDHSGGLRGVLRNMPVDRVASGTRELVSERPNGEQCQRGQQWRWSGVDFQVLWPPAGHSLSSNNSSCVLLITWNSQSILLTGDITAEVESLVLEDPLLPAELNLLVAAHHGSKTSSSAEFVEQLKPQAVVFSAGYRNRYGHPHPDVVSRFEAVNSSAYHTGEDGAISFYWAGATDSEPKVERAREVINRAWH